MREKTGKPIAFRPYERIRKRLEIAREAGLDMSEVLNEILDKDLDAYLVCKFTSVGEKIVEANNRLSAMGGGLKALESDTGP
jgi:hypothetical protein